MACKAEQNAGRSCECLRLTFLLAISDQGAENVGAFTKIDKAISKKTWNRFTRPFCDSYHLIRGERNGSAGWVLSRKGECISMAFLNGLRCGSDKEIADALAAAASEQVFGGIDKQSQVYMAFLMRGLVIL